MKVHPAMASHRLGLALLASACAHAILLGLALRSVPESGGMAVSQRKGALTVLSMGTSRSPASRPARPAPAPVATANTAQHRPAIHAPTPLRTPLPSPEPPPVPENVEPVKPLDAISAKAPPSEAPPAAPVPISAQPPSGSAFTSLFAPILSQPLGRGRWGAPPRHMPPPDPMQLRQQAWLALTTDLRQRLEGLPHVTCDIQFDADSREGEVQCASPEDTAQVWALLQGLLRPGSARPIGASALCLHLGSGQTLMQTCPTDTNRTAP